MRSLVFAAVAAGILSIVSITIVAAHDDHSTGQWPASCIDLNDIVETHLGNHGNVGIYQRVYGDQAEEHCQNDHRSDVRATFVWAFPSAPHSPSGGTPSGGWPATCVQLNDIVEAHLGNHDNVGIYQHAYGHQAEQACRNEHQADVEAAFAWAFDTTPVSTPQPAAAAGSVPTAPRNLRAQPLSIGWGNDVRVLADPPADGGGLPLLGYRWRVAGATVRAGSLASSGGEFSITLDDLSGGDHTFTLSAYNARGDGPAVSVSFAVSAPPERDPTLEAALDLILNLVESEWTEMAELVESPEVRATRIVFGPLPSSSHAARYSPADDTITFNEELRGERLVALAATLAHEIWHVGAHHGRWYPRTVDGCFQNEIAAADAAAAVWYLARAGRPQSDFEWHHQAALNARNKGTLERRIRGQSGYKDQCSRWAS